VLIKLSRDYTEVLKYPVSYVDLPADKIVTNELDTVFTIKLKSKGYRILSNKLFFKPQTINIDVFSLLRKKKDLAKENYIATSDLYQLIGTQINYTNNVISVFPDTIYFHLEKLHSKKVPLKVKLNISFAQQYKLSDSIKSSPDSVILSGTKSAIDSIRYIETLSKTLANLNQSQTITLGFDSKYARNKIKITPSSLKINIPVEKYTEATVELPILIINNFGKNAVRTFPEKVNITYLVSLNKFKEVKPEMFTVVADISKAISSRSKKMKLEIQKYPSFVEISKIDPEKVEFLFIK
jgi:YbbR domain-containing protein